MVVARGSSTLPGPTAAPVAAPSGVAFDEPFGERRVRHEVADGAAVVVFSLGTSVALAFLLGLALHLAG